MANENVIQATFDGFYKTYTEPSWFIDHGMELSISGIDLPDEFECHFSNSRSVAAKRQIGENGVVTIPDEYFLSNAAQIFCWIYLHPTVDSGVTEYEIVIPLLTRPNVDPAEPTQEQQDIVDQAIAALNVAMAETSADAESASASATAAQAAVDSVLNMTVSADTLPSGSDASVTKSVVDDAVHLAFGIPQGAQGVQGEQGVQGPTGATPNFTIGTVQTLLPTQDATATITGTEEEPVLNLGIPKGYSGDANNLAADYSSTKTYAVGDYCIYNGSLYRCITAITTAEAWTAAHWTAASLGDDVSSLKIALNDVIESVSTGCILIEQSDLEIGIWNQAGSKATDDRAIRVNRPIPVTKDDILLLNTGSLYIRYFILDKSGTQIQVRPTTNDRWQKGNFTDTVSGDGMLYISFRNNLAYGSSTAIISSAYDGTTKIVDSLSYKNKTEIDGFSGDISNLKSAAFSNNLVGLKKDVYYRIDPPIKNGEKFTLSVPDGVNLTTYVDYEWCDSQKTEISHARYYSGYHTPDTKTVSGDDMYYFRWKTQPPKILKVERGSQATAYAPYFEPYNFQAEGLTIASDYYKQRIVYPDAFTEAFFVGASSGVMTASNNYKTTSLIPLQTGDVLNYRLSGAASDAIIAIYNKAGEFIESLVTGAGNAIAVEGTVTIAQDCYAIISHRTSGFEDKNPYFYINNSVFRRADISVPIQDAKENTFVSGYGTLTGWESHAISFSKLMEDVGKTEGFLFFTDSHFMSITSGGWKPYAYDIMAYIEKLYYSTPCSFVLHGGDWLGSGEPREDYLYKLSAISGMFRRNFDRYALLVGNHETGNQSQEQEMFTHDTLSATLMAHFGKTYYLFKANTFNMYCFDTWQSGQLDAYGKQQIAWFASELERETSEHIVAAMHILYDEAVLSQMGEQISLCAQAYNSKGTYTYDGNTYNFGNAVGKVGFIIAGHEHGDRTGTINDIPFILTKNLTGYGGEANFYQMSPLPLDLVKVDWNTKKLTAYRATRGSAGTTRDLTIISN